MSGTQEARPLLDHPPASCSVQGDAGELTARFFVVPAILSI